MDATFTVEVGAEAPVAFANLSGDWNPLHTDAAYAAGTPFGRPVLHGAYLTGLMSRLAGMHLPGKQCLLHGVSLRFLAPVLPPVTLTVAGDLVGGTREQGRVAVRIIDATSGVKYAEGHYDFGLHVADVQPQKPEPRIARPSDSGSDVTLVTGASGALATALLARLPGSGLGVSRSTEGSGTIRAAGIEQIGERLGNRRLADVVHCAWPPPDNEALTDLADIHAATEFNLAAPVREIVALAQLLKQRGGKDATLVLIGSTAAEPGRHNYRMPLYTLGKSLVPTLARVLATELAATGQRCLALVFDVLEGGMNSRLSLAARAAHRDRSPFGRIASLDEAAGQILWALDNRSYLASGATVFLTGTAAP